MLAVQAISRLVLQVISWMEWGLTRRQEGRAPPPPPPPTLFSLNWSYPAFRNSELSLYSKLPSLAAWESSLRAQEARLDFWELWLSVLLLINPSAGPLRLSTVHPTNVKKWFCSQWAAAVHCLDVPSSLTTKLLSLALSKATKPKNFGGKYELGCSRWYFCCC